MLFTTGQADNIQLMPLNDVDTRPDPAIGKLTFPLFGKSFFTKLTPLHKMNEGVNGYRIRPVVERQ